VTQACKTGSGASTVICANPDQYLFWDGVHPTTRGHSFIAAAAFAMVPEPEALALFVLALVAVASRRALSRA
jgi:phospholipase/lecithinase/hemolysin